jgi:L-seryl-tRNA(Ser) seleniumtransferase
VNNCAAATMLALNSLAQGGEVIVSRGELVEIGGSFRIPDVMEKSGAVLREVGTTNRTRIADYESAISSNTKLLMRVSRSNFAITGFTEQPAIEELVELGRKHGIPVFEDHGNGSLVNLRHFGVNDASVHTVQESLRARVDVIAYSGDKLLGGPQAGMLTGETALVQKMRRNPLFRALRVDKLTYAALGATLQAYLQQDYDAIPALRMLNTSADDIRTRAHALAARITGAEVIEGESTVGGGTAPTSVLPTFLLAIKHSHYRADELEDKLRAGDPPVIARIQDHRVVLDLRTVFPEQDKALATVLAAVTGHS